MGENENENENEISKKALLEETGISYGQLYRWKREGLIPEEWFIKRSAYTGQETYFPRDQVCRRIQAILDLKDSHSLDEIRDVLCSHGNTRFDDEALGMMVEINKETLSRLSAARGASLTLEDWAQIAGVYEAGVEAELTYNDLVALTDAAVAWVRQADADATASAAVQPSTGERHPAAQVSVVSVGGAHHFLTSSVPTELQGDATLVVKATRQTKAYVERAQAALLSRA
ncbi:MAG: YhbD family protein [Coriobacteriales bacterium]|jgi:DNA-binding transcriptional MerR regulator|nr:YhbD family protein [Coriobacteriales bacterium]